MPRTLEQWTESVSKKLDRTIPEAIRKTKAAELIRAVREMQDARPKKHRWRRKAGAKRLHQSIKIDAERQLVYADHPAVVLEDGMTVRARKHPFLRIPLLARWAPGRAGFITLPIKGGRRVVVRKSRIATGGIFAIMVRQVRLPRTLWITHGRVATLRGSEDRVADGVLKGVDV